jgi:hypothetical protein
MNRIYKGLVLFLIALSVVFTFCACTQKGEAPGSAAVEKVTLNKKTLELTSGESFQLVATVSPEGASQEVKWAVSSGKDYASVSADGKVKVTNTGNSSATAKVTATSVADPTKKATCTITVKIGLPSKFTLSKIGMVTAGPGENASESMIISWHSPANGSFLEYTDADGETFTNAVANADCNEALSTAKWADTATHYRCKVTLEGLSAGSTYKYRINDGSGNYTDVATFRTAEADTTDFQFMWLSDLHTGKYGSNYIKRVEELIDLANAKDGVDLDFCLFTGDMVNKGQIYRHWQYWSDSKLLNDMTYAFVCGNHDYYPYDSKDRTTNAYFKDACAFPANNTAGGKTVLDSNYWFIWNRVLFVCIDNFTSEGTETQKLAGASLSAQKDWFKAVLDSIPTSDYDYLIYCQHLPFFIDDEPCSYGQYTDWRDLFDEYKVDFALSSDEHAYTRTNPLLNDAKQELTDGKVTTGTVYMTSYETEGSSIGTASNQSAKKNGGKYAAFYGGGGVGGGVYFTVTPTEMTMHLICANGVEKDSVAVLKKTR